MIYNELLHATMLNKELLGRQPKVLVVLNMYGVCAGVQKLKVLRGYKRQ